MNGFSVSDNINAPWGQPTTPNAEAPNTKEELSIVYSGRPSPIAKIQLFNILMLIPTLGVYRFWAITRLRRYFWSSLSFNGTKLEYTGRGKELFMGLLVVLIVLVPLAIIATTVSEYLLVSSPNLAIAFNLLVLLIFYFLGYAAFFLRRRYLLSRTKWRGIRMALKGSPWAFGLFGLKQAFFQIITFGLYSPFASMNLHTKLWGNSHVGSHPIKSKRIMEGLYWAFIPLWLLNVFGFIVLGGAVAYIVWAGFMLMSAELGTSLISLSLMKFVVGACIWVAAIFWFTMLYQARKIRNVIRGLNFQSLRFQSTFGGLHLVKTYLIVILILIPIGIAVFYLTGLTVGNPFSDSTNQFAGIFLFYSLIYQLTIALLVTYIVSLFLIPVVVTHRMFRDLVATTATGGEFDAALIEQSEAEVMSRGEGLANALDVGGF